MLFGGRGGGNRTVRSDGALTGTTEKSIMSGQSKHAEVPVADILTKNFSRSVTQTISHLQSSFDSGLNVTRYFSSIPDATRPVEAVGCENQW